MKWGGVFHGEDVMGNVIKGKKGKAWGSLAFQDE